MSAEIDIIRTTDRGAMAAAEESKDPSAQSDAEPDATRWDPVAHPTRRLPGGVGEDTPTVVDQVPAQPAGGPPAPRLPPPNPSTRSDSFPVARLAHGGTALVAIVALVVQLSIAVTEPADLPGEADVLLDYFALLPVLTALLVAVVALMLAANPIRASRSVASLRLATLLMCVAAIMGYLMGTPTPFGDSPAQDVTAVLLGYVVPIVALVSYGLFGPRPRLEMAHIPMALVYPALWFGYAFVRGEIAGSSMYAFLDTSARGYGGVAAGAAVVSLMGLAVTLGLVLVDRAVPWAPRH